jgi:hypothetical protein
MGVEWAAAKRRRYWRHQPIQPKEEKRKSQPYIV